MQSPGSRQDYKLHRVVFAADDPLTLTDVDKGVNMGGYLKARIQVIPINTRTPPKDPAAWPAVPVALAATTDPSVDVYFWSAALGRYIFGQALTGTPAVPQEWDVECGERKMLVALANNSAANEAVAILVAGQHAEPPT